MALDQFDDGPRGPIHKFRIVGDGIAATIIDGGRQQARTMEGKPKFFEDGQPMMTDWIEVGQITKAISDGEPVEHEDGRCRVFFGGFQFKAFKEARIAMLPHKMAEGDLIVIKCHNLKKNPNGGEPSKELTIALKEGTAESIAYAQKAKAEPAKAVYNEDEEPF